MSDCDSYQAELSALLDDALPKGEAETLSAHVAECGACQAEHDALLRVKKQVGALPRLSAPPEFAAGLWARVGKETATATSEKPGVLVAKAVSPPKDGTDVQVLPTEAPANACDAFHEDVSALLDRALTPAREAEVRAHLAECASCTELGIDLQRIRDRVGGLTPLRVPPEFVRTIMDKAEAIEREKVDAEMTARAARAKWFVQLGKLAQAAALLLVVGGGVLLATPQDSYRQSLPGFSSPNANARNHARRQARAIAAKKQAVDVTPAPLPAGDAEWELAVTNVSEGQSATRRLLDSYAQNVRQRPGERSFGFYATIPRNLVDDLHRGLVGAPSVQTTALSEQAMHSMHAEQDQVVLKSGFVLVGQVLDPAQPGRAIRVRSGSSTVHSVPSKDVERIERAAETRTLRILLYDR
jgi:anti-sigma factor RsiW